MPPSFRSGAAGNRDQGMALVAKSWMRLVAGGGSGAATATATAVFPQPLLHRLSVTRSYHTPLYEVKVGIPEFLKGVGDGVEAHVSKLEAEIGDLQRLLVTRTLRLKKIGIPCKHGDIYLLSKACWVSCHCTTAQVSRQKWRQPHGHSVYNYDEMRFHKSRFTPLSVLFSQVLAVRKLFDHICFFSDKKIDILAIFCVLTLVMLVVNELSDWEMSGTAMKVVKDFCTSVSPRGLFRFVQSDLWAA
ncbi:hypothetical protein Cni_G20557 [Canna indica]|uniref:Small ribosomal subunit protein mS41 SAM domain-containing protein n=1 Tax=Canna indica TaxID=4628 RepID=A0AAQ3KMV0_9LILI|nr:hypothetical protein Cni_G20557 [Canna indica]